MKRFVIGIVAVLLLSASAAFAFAGGLVPGARGCVWRSVDERSYVRSNEAVLRSISLHPRLRRAYANTWTHGISAPNGCLPFENGPPYSAFITTHVFARPPGERPIGFDARVLGREWVRQSALGTEQTYRKGRASLSVTNDDEGVLLRVDHRAYDRGSG